MMKAYIEVRTQCEAMIRQSGMDATILRPWYVLGPGHRWPYFLIPIYKLMELLPATRAVREQVDWAVVRDATADNDFATAFLFLVERLGIVTVSE